MPRDDHFLSLLKLLDDDNEQSATLAMAELLAYPDVRLERVLRTLQESSSPKLRRRIHQIQSAITRRRRRKMLAGNFSTGTMDILDVLIQFHLLWFDNDTEEQVRKQWNDFLAEFDKKNIRNFSGIGDFLNKKITYCSGIDDYFHAEDICIGTILEDASATDFMLAVIANLLSERRGFHSFVFSVNGKFGVCQAGRFYFAESKWKKADPEEIMEPYKEWTSRELSELVSANLFALAVATDSFRYIHTLGTCMTKREDVRFLPYPYGDPEENQSRLTIKKR